MYVLTVTHGPDQGKKTRLVEGQTCRIGSDPGSALVLDDPKVLEGHCSVRVTGESVVLENHTASAGTWIGDRKVARADLKPGMSFRIGDSRIRLGRLARAPAAAEQDPLLGKIIGGYKINEVVGSGGMGTVYKATQLSLHRDIALKVLRPRLAKDKAFIDLFVAEARAAAQLVDPNIVQVYDAGTESEISYFAMEFIGQGSVEELLDREQKLAWEDAILMVLEAAHGLDYAEGKGVVHRDMKPDNLMINDDGRVKIADLGLAKRSGSSKDQGIIGTPHFIPPEQALGKEVDGRADIYSLGATFFRMVTGRTVFSGKTAKEIVLKHVKEPPPAASSIESSIPDEVDAAIARMLAKDPGGRFQSAKELIAALESICAQHGIKGAIIKKGIPKRVLIPVAILTLAAVGVAIHFATRPERTIMDTAAEERNKQLEERRKEDARKLREVERATRKLESDSQLQKLENDALRLPPIEETYDEEEATSVRREKAWQEMTKDYRDFAETELAKEFGNDIAARKTADRIEKDLAGLKSVRDDMSAWIKAQVTEAGKTDEAQRAKLSELRKKSNYGDALNLCEKLSREKPSKSDPFREVERAEWVSPLDKAVKRPAQRIPKIMDVIKAARQNMAKERKVVLLDATSQWDGVHRMIKALEQAKNPTDAEIEEVITAAGEVERDFPAAQGGTPTEIAGFVKQARRDRVFWQAELTRRQTERIQNDRLAVRSTLRKQRSRDPGAIPNLVMDCEIDRAIDTWQQQLQRDTLKTERYIRFAKERIEMLRWVQYIYWRFHTDLVASIENKAAGPMRTLALEMIQPGLPPGQAAKTYQDRLTRPPNDVFKFAVSKRVQGEKEVRFGQMPMDWVYHAAFFHQGTPRWKEITPVLEFALGIFCMETMQFKPAAEHFEKLLKDQRYKGASKVLLGRARTEDAAVQEYIAIMSVLGREGVKAKDVQDALRQLDSFHTRHEGTLFYLDVMRLKDPIRKDVDGRVVPDLPTAPPRQ